jgi:hypothetical protein
MKGLGPNVIGSKYTDSSVLTKYNLSDVNTAIENHAIENVGRKLRSVMSIGENQEVHV